MKSRLAIQYRWYSTPWQRKQVSDSKALKNDSDVERTTVQMTAKRTPISRLTRLEVQVLLRTGHRQKEVAKLTSVPLRTVQRIAREPVVTALDEPSSHPRGRPSDIERFREPIVEWLSAEPGMDTVDVLARARAEGYDGGKTALYSLVRSLRHTEASALRPGAVSEHDYGRVRVRLRDGAEKRLAFSRWIQASRGCPGRC